MVGNLLTFYRFLFINRILLALLLFNIIGCDSKPKQEYYLYIIKYDNFLNDTITEIDTIGAANDMDAYLKGRVEYYIGFKAYEYTSDTSFISTPISVDVLNVNGNNLNDLISDHRRDSIDKLIRKQILGEIDSTQLSLNAYADSLYDTGVRRRTKEITYENVKDQFSAWDGSHEKTVKWLKKNLHNPKSFEHLETRYVKKDRNLIILMNFRAENGFGAIRTSTAIATCDLYTGDVIEGSINLTINKKSK